MKTRGYFSLGTIPPTRETPDMAEIPTTVEDTSFQAGHYSTEVPQRRSGRGRAGVWSNLFSGRRSSGKDAAVGVGGGGGYATDVTRATSFDTSRAPSAHSPAIGGLHAPPGRHNQVPPVPSLPTNYGGDQGNQVASLVDSGDFHRDNGDRYPQGPGSVRDTVLRDSTTLGIGVHSGPSHIQMPEESPVSPPYSVTPVTSGPANMSSPHTSDISGNSSGHLRSYPMAPYRQHEEMPPSPIAGGGYMEADNGFVPGTTRHGEPPMAPLPLPPDPRRGQQQQQQHRRDRSADSVPRLPMSHSTEYLPTEERAGESSVGRRNSRKKDAHVSVQVRVNPDGKSVTVRRVPAEEGERDRRERARLRAERAANREMSLDRDRQHRRSHSGRRSSERHERHERPTTSGSGAHAPPAPASSVGGYGPESSVGGYAPSIGAQSSTIAGASGGLLGGGAPPPQGRIRMPEAPRVPGPRASAPLNPASPPPLPYGLGGGVSPSARGSVVSASGTAENSELEQEAAKSYRKKKIREGTSSLGNPLSSLGARYDEDGVEWT